MSGYKVGILTNEAVASLNKLEAGFKKAKVQSKKHEDALKTFKKQLSDTGGGLNAFKSQLGELVKWIGAAAIAYKTFQAAVDAVKVGAKFQHEMNAVKAVTRATVSQFAALTDAAKMAGATTEFSASQAAQALRFLGMAGLTAEESIAALPGTINLATAGNIDLATSADIATNILSGMNLAVSDLAKVNDVLIATTTRSNTNITELGEAMKHVAPLASGLGYSIEETSAFLGILANSGLKASIAGTNLSGIFRRLPKIFEALGMDGEGKTVVDAFEAISKQGWDAGKIMKEFGAISGKAAIILSNNTEELKKFTGELNNSSGEAEAAAEIMRSGVTGALKELNSTLEGMKIEFFERYKDQIEASIRWTTKLTRAVADFFGVLSKPALEKFGEQIVSLNQRMERQKSIIKDVKANTIKSLFYRPLPVLEAELVSMQTEMDNLIAKMKELQTAGVIEVRKEQHIEAQIKEGQDHINFWKEINSEMDKLISKDERRLKLQEQMKQAALEAQIKAAAEQGALQPGAIPEGTQPFGIRTEDPYEQNTAQSMGEAVGSMSNVASAIAKLVEMIINFFYDFPDRLESAMFKMEKMGEKWQEFLNKAPQLFERSIAQGSEIFTKGIATLFSAGFWEKMHKSIAKGAEIYFSNLFGIEVDESRDIDEDQLEALKGLKKSLEGDKGLTALTAEFNDLSQQQQDLQESSKDYWGDQVNLIGQQIELLDKIKAEQEKTRDELKSALNAVKESIDIISGAEYSLALAPDTMENMGERYSDLLGKAQAGDLDATKELSGFVQTYLKQGQALYGSSVEYQQLYGQVLQDMTGIEGALEGQLTEAEQQLAATESLKEALHADLTRLIEIGEGQLIGIEPTDFSELFKALFLYALIEALQWFWDTHLSAMVKIWEEIRDALVRTRDNLSGVGSEGDTVGDIITIATGGLYADGGIATGPMSGYPATLHGTEAVIPLKNGSVPVQIDNSSVVSAINNQNKILFAILEKDLKIDAKSFDNRVSKVADKTTSKSNNRGMAGRIYA